MDPKGRRFSGRLISSISEFLACSSLCIRVAKLLLEHRSACSSHFKHQSSHPKVTKASATSALVSVGMSQSGIGKGQNHAASHQSGPFFVRLLTKLDA